MRAKINFKLCLSCCLNLFFSGIWAKYAQAEYDFKLISTDVHKEEDLRYFEEVFRTFTLVDR